MQEGSPQVPGWYSEAYLRGCWTKEAGKEAASAEGVVAQGGGFGWAPPTHTHPGPGGGGAGVALASREDGVAKGKGVQEREGTRRRRGLHEGDGNSAGRLRGGSGRGGA